MKNHETELAKKDLIIKSQQEKLLDLQLEIVRLNRQLPTDSGTRKKELFQHAMGRLEVIHSGKKSKDFSCTGS